MKRIRNKGGILMNENYKILLVDDEEEVRASIIKKIDWEKAGFTVIGHQDYS